MVSVVRCWKAEYQKCKHSILLYMHSMIPIICAAIFAGYYHISRWELATKISAYLEVLAVAFPFLIGIIVGLVVQIENQAGHYQLLLGTIPSRMATYIFQIIFTSFTHTPNPGSQISNSAPCPTADCSQRQSHRANQKCHNLLYLTTKNWVKTALVWSNQVKLYQPV